MDQQANTRELVSSSAVVGNPKESWWKRLLSLVNTRVRLEDIERLSGAAILSMIPEVTSPNTQNRNIYLGTAEPVGSIVESFRLLRNNIKNSDPLAKVIAISSAYASEGKSTVALNLAIALAMDGVRVLLIDFDLRKPSVHEKVGVSNGVGVTSVLGNELRLREAIKPSDFEGVFVLTSGPLPSDSVEALNSYQTQKLIRDAREEYDFLVVDTPPCIGLSDMPVIGTLVDGIVMVVSIGKIRKRDLATAFRGLRQSGTTLLGSATIGTPRRGYYNYYYSYYSYYSDDSKEIKPKRGRVPKVIKR